MKLFTPRLASVLLALVAAAAVAPSAHAQTGTPRDPYVITSAPYTISKAGYYVLGNSLNYTATSGNIITVGANNVTLDLNGFFITGPKTASQIVTGIYANDKSNLTVTNGTVAYCYTGINITGTSGATTNNVGHHIYDLRITYCYRLGMEVDEAPGTLIERNQISQIGGTTTTNSYTVGIYFLGSGGTLIGNVISTVNPSSGGAAGSSYAISAGGGSFATRNTLSNAANGIQGGCKYQDNLTFGCTTPFSGGTDAGGNN